MTEPTPENRPPDSHRKESRVLLLVLVVALLGVIGVGSLQVFQHSGDSETAANLEERSSRFPANGTPLGAGPNVEQARTARPAPEEANDPGFDPATEFDDAYVLEPYEDATEEEPELSISGAVLDDTGELLPGIFVEARHVGRPAGVQAEVPFNGGVSKQQTDQLGGFTFDNLSEGEYELATAKSDQYHAVKLRVRAGVANAELVLQRIRSVRVYGNITDDVGNPLGNVQVRALGSKLKVFSDAAGDYEIETGPSKAGQPPVLDFSLEGYEETRRRVAGVVGSEDPEVQLDVKMVWESDAPKVAVYGLVYGPGTEPVVGATVWLSSYEYRTSARTRSDSEGEYRFEQIKVGDAYTLSVKPRDTYESFRSDLLSVGPGDLNYDVMLEETGVANLSGTLTDLGGSPLRDFMLWARNTDMGQHQPLRVHSDGAGQFRLEQIPSGTFRLESRSQPWLEVTGIVLEPGETRRIEVPLDWGQRWLLGQVVDELGDPVPRAKVVLQWTHEFAEFRSDSRREVMSDQGGYFALSNLDADVYTVTVRATGFNLLRTEHAMSQDEEELRLILTRQN